MKELEQFLENELNGLALKKADWGHLTIEDDSRERTLLEVKELVKKLPIHDVVGRSEHLICETCKSGLIVFLIEQEAEKYSDAFESKGIAKESFIKGAKFILNHLKPKKCKCSIPQPSFINSNLCNKCMYEIK